MQNFGFVFLAKRPYYILYTDCLAIVFHRPPNRPVLEILYREKAYNSFCHTCNCKVSHTT
ncbi:hypothetical protein HAPAU_36630 [Halalkalicoccus paucihalophilus]|uniref:Uncharacterized protein n=1 Tax=Halalkalicoccus paucihalophilus TaxID=1008153 RepID=A0A151A9M2_9EURY|nr:hypothetical protein HAPAU_36630 [Halalkalicoccus paucihalophilus]